MLDGNVLDWLAWSLNPSWFSAPTTDRYPGVPVRGSADPRLWLGGDLLQGLALAVGVPSED